MKKNFLVLFISLLLSSLLVGCDYLGSGKVKNLVDLTPRLEVGSPAAIELVSSHQDIKLDYRKKTSYKLNKNKLSAAPAIAKSIVYSLDEKGYLSAFSLKKGEFLWSNQIKDYDSEQNSGAVLYSNDKLYVTNGSRDLLIIDAKTGVEILRKTFSDILNTKPVMVDDRLLVVQTISNKLIGFDTIKAKSVWVNEGGIEFISSKSQISPINVNGNILASFSSGEVVMVDAKNGHNKWMINLTNNNRINAHGFDPSVIITRPITYNDHLYFATSNGLIMKVKITNGQIVWQKEIDDVQTMSISGDNLIITTNGRQAGILAVNDGNIKWTGDLISSKDRLKTKIRTVIFQTAFVVNDVNNKQVLNFISSNGELYQFAVDNGKIAVEPKIISIPSGVINYWISCCNNKVHLFTDRLAIF